MLEDRLELREEDAGREDAAAGHDVGEEAAGYHRPPEERRWHGVCAEFNEKNNAPMLISPPPPPTPNKSTLTLNVRVCALGTVHASLAPMDFCA